MDRHRSGHWTRSGTRQEGETAIRFESILKIVILQLTVAYKGYLRDGTKFDESSEKGFTFRLGLNEVIKGWDKGLLGTHLSTLILFNWSNSSFSVLRNEGGR